MSLPSIAGWCVMCTRKGPFDEDGELVCDNTEPDHDPEAEVGHTYSSTSGVKRAPKEEL